MLVYHAVVDVRHKRQSAGPDAVRMAGEDREVAAGGGRGRRERREGGDGEQLDRPPHPVSVSEQSDIAPVISCYLDMADKETKTHAALYVRLPVDEADKLDRAAFALKAAKQDPVARLLARHVDPSSPAGLDALRDLAGAAKQGRRVTVETADDTLTLGRHEVRPAEA